MSEYKPIDECKTVEELLADPARWTKGFNALTKDGFSVNPKSEKAECFCLRGAIRRVYGGFKHTPQYRLLRNVIDEPVVDWNDDCDRTHAEVLAAVRKAGI